ncbi:metallophosphoesterase [bacterium]|nr:metallophosphoesterase [bacterium]
MLCFFVSDLHGRIGRYLALLERIESEIPDALFLGGDLLPMDLDLSWASETEHRDFISDFLIPAFSKSEQSDDAKIPRSFLILGNDDPRYHEETVLQGQKLGIWEYLHGRSVEFESRTVHGYSHIPPTPFQLKDWERYDVSRFVDPGCISPEEGRRSVEVDTLKQRYSTIEKDLAKVAQGRDLRGDIFLFHSPPYQSLLDRAALDGQSVDHVPLDVHVGSIAIRRFIEEQQPALTLHGHVHESTRLTGKWMDRIGDTVCLQAAHDGPELSLIRFDPDEPANATRELIPV